MTTAAAPPLVTLDDIRAAARPPARRRDPDAARRVRAAGGAALPQGRVAPADRRVQAARRLRGRRVALRPRRSPAGSSPTRRATTPRASRAPRACSGAPAVVVMPSDAPAIKRERVAADGAEIVIVGTASDERQRVAEEIAARARPGDHPAVRRRPDHRRPGHGRSRDRRGPAGRRRRPRPDRRRRAGQRRRDRDRRPSDPAVRVIGVEPELAADARESLERGEIVALAGRARVAHDRRRDADAGARRADVRPPAALSRCRSSPSPRPRSPPPSGWRPNGAGSSSSRRARWASPRWRSMPRELGLDRARRSRRRRGQRRQRRSGALPGVPRGADPAEG